MNDLWNDYYAGYTNLCHFLGVAPLNTDNFLEFTRQKINAS